MTSREGYNIFFLFSKPPSPTPALSPSFYQTVIDADVHQPRDCVLHDWICIPSKWIWIAQITWKIGLGVCKHKHEFTTLQVYPDPDAIQFLKGGPLSHCLLAQSTSSQPYVNWLNSASTSINDKTKFHAIQLEFPGSLNLDLYNPLFAHNTHKNGSITCCQISKVSIAITIVPLHQRRAKPSGEP